MKKLSLILTLLTIFSLGSRAQELNCQVTVIAPAVGNVEASVFDGLESTILEFMNNRKWTGDQFDIDERIECRIQMTINEVYSLTSFRATMQISASRPIYNSDQKTTTLLANDSDVQFTFLENSILNFSPDQHKDNLTSILAFYAYMILGNDYDTFSSLGGTEHYLKAQIIVSNAQNVGEAGWKASQSNSNRYWMVENVLSQTFKPMRDCMYLYHREGLDKIVADAAKSRQVMSEAIYDLDKVHKVRPSSYNMQLFFLAKSDEIVNIYRGSDNTTEKQLVYLTLKRVDPGNISKYESIMK